MSELASKGQKVASMVTELAEYTDAPQSFCDELEDTVEDYVEEVASLEESEREARERLDNLEASHKITQESLWGLEDTVLGEFDLANPRFDEQSIIDQLDDVEARLDGANPGEDGDKVTPEDGWTPIEQVATFGEMALDDHVGPSDRRAIEIFQHWTEWSSKTPAGQVIKTGKDGLRKLLSAATGERLSWKQVYRACRHVERLSKGTITFFKNSDSDLILQQHRPFSSRQAQTSDGVTASSATS